MSKRTYAFTIKMGAAHNELIISEPGKDQVVFELAALRKERLTSKTAHMIHRTSKRLQKRAA